MMADASTAKPSSLSFIKNAALLAFLVLNACTARDATIEPASPDIDLRSDAPWPALQPPWSCVSGTPIAVSGRLVETGLNGFVMHAAHRNINVSLENLREVDAKHFRVGDEVSVTGTAGHGPFAQPTLNAQFIVETHLVGSAKNDPRANKAYPVDSASICTAKVLRIQP